ncbi:hypothetical protein [Sanyastnella coralliicola]|uniref:hypothetical protein n=1 Tax=Sanyastnella coralliicola TaxID=3069118 RepID=UPI0027B8A7B5|nr:hypothetical protein [Longitalea sp. SCSIO 12813]
METAKQAGEITWEILKIIGEIVWNNLPTFMLWVFIGFIVGVVLGIVTVRYCRKKGVYSRPVTKKIGKVLNFMYSPIMFLCVLFLSLTFFTYVGTKKVVRNEIHHGVDVSMNLLGEYLVEDDETRRLLYERANFILQSGAYVKELNHTMAEAAIEASSEAEGNGWLVTQFAKFVLVDDIEENLLEYEKGVSYYFAMKTLDKAGVGESLMIEYETFEAAFDAWLEADFAADVQELEDTITDYCCGFINPYILGFFVPFLLFTFFIFAIPLLHYFIAMRMLKKSEAGLESL